MANISSAGIYVDCKALLSWTRRLISHLSNKDRIHLGDYLVRENVEMIASFSLAYAASDERFTFDDGDTLYEGELKGQKRKYVEDVMGHYYAYVALFEEIFDNVQLERLSAEKRDKLHGVMIELLGKIDNGINRWQKGIYKQVIVSKTIRHNAV